MKRIAFTIVSGFILSFVFAGLSNAQLFQLTSDLPSGQPVGTKITWTVSGGSPDMKFRLSVGEGGNPARIVYDFGPDSVFEWTTIADGNYCVVATIDDSGTLTEVEAPYTIVPIADIDPVVNSTPHPLIALYSAPACAAGLSMRVRFGPVNGAWQRTTSLKRCRPAHSMNFYIAGMIPRSAFRIKHEILDGLGATVENGPILPFTTGRSPVHIEATVVDPPDNTTSRSERLMLHGSTGDNAFPFATDLTGRMVWYYDAPAIGEGGATLNRWLSGGNFLVRAPSGGISNQLMQEIDLAGNIVRQVSAQRITDQLPAFGQTEAFTAFHHESRQLPNGNLAVLGHLERMVEDLQGPGLINVLAYYIVVLDNNWQVKWVWNAFDHLDVSRVAILGEICTSEAGGCPPISTPSANDWLHSNALDYSPPDGNLIISVRHQDWVVKVDYDDGAGTGAVIWRLGPEGDFSLDSADPFPWLSHAHDTNFIADNELLVFDNGNTRCVQTLDCENRGQLYLLDETTMSASLLLDARLGTAVYSPALGSAQKLQNGNFHFDSGLLNLPDVTSFHQEVLPDGSIAYSLDVVAGVYRSFRMPDLYTAP